MTGSLTLADIEALYNSLPPVLDVIELHVHPESPNRYRDFFDASEKENKSAFGSTLIPIRENKYLPIYCGVLRNVTQDKYMPVYFEDFK